MVDIVENNYFTDKRLDCYWITSTIFGFIISGIIIWLHQYAIGGTILENSRELFTPKVLQCPLSPQAPTLFEEFHAPNEKSSFLAVVLATIYLVDADDGHTKVLSATHGGSHTSKFGGGDSKGGKKYSEHGHTGKSGRRSKHDHEKARKGQEYKELHKVEDEEDGGKKTKYHQEDSHKSYKKSGGGSSHGLKYEEGSNNKKNNAKKGFREKYHKDEANNHDSFYSNHHKSGEYNVFGQGHEKHSSKSSAKKQAGNHKKSKSESARGKGAKKAGGHNVSDKKGHQHTKSSKSHHNHGGSFGKKGSSSGGKSYHFDSDHRK